jgi:DNA polymerase-3 subunit delta'
MDEAPLCYSQLFGQQKAKLLLSKALAAHRLPHGYIFKGPEGVGKKLYGRGLAAALNCKDINRIGACGICPSCKKYRSKNHPDYMEISPQKGLIKIDQIRQLTKEISFPPYESAFRVVIIEDVHTMRREAANSLLKTLEEPPVGNLLILTAESSQEILATLTSRCQVIPFLPLSLSETCTILKQHDIDQDTAMLLARLSEGSPGKALIYHQLEMIDVLREVIRFVSDPKVDADRDVGQLIRIAEKISSLKDDCISLLSLLRLWVRDLLLGEDGITAMVYTGFPAATPLKSWSSDELFAKLQALDRAEQELARNCNRSLVAEVLLFKLQ